MPHRANVDSVRQPATKTVLKSSEGWEIPCQPFLNSSINFFIGMSLHVISESKIWPSMPKMGDFVTAKGSKAGEQNGTSPLAMPARGGNIDGTDGDRGTIWDGWTAR